MPGEVVYDSIIQNKSKIKSYWEQLMLAAELANQQAKASPQHNHVYQHHVHAQHAQHGTHAAHTHVAADKAQSPDISEAEFYDALSHISAAQSPELVDKDGSGEGVKAETVVERDIRIQQERELALTMERQRALRSAKDKTIVGGVGGGKRDDTDEAYLSIPTTDEGNYSEYGSEDKEDHSPDGSRVMSPVGPTSMSSHHRTQSLDSMSSGHSSGSGTASHPDLCLKPEPRPTRQTFGPVKPLDEPEDVSILAYVKENASSPLTEDNDVEMKVEAKESSDEAGSDKETPIEREIRFSREREEELRRDKLISSAALASPLHQKQDPEKKKESTRVSPATQRVQHEIEVASEREKELKRWSSGDLPKDITPKNLLKPTANKSIKTTPVLQNGDIKKDLQETPKSASSVKSNGASPKIYIQNPQQKGLMKRFLASRGKMGSTPKLNSPSSPSSATLPPLKTPALSPSSLMAEPFFSFTSLVQTKGREEPLNLGNRPGYKSAEDKIQSELREMKRREEELRQQRRSNLYSARSQPDLLNIGLDPMIDRDSGLCSEEEPARLPNMSKLRSALSVQNLLDIDDKPVPRRLPKRKSALIEQWESRIQNKN